MILKFPVWNEDKLMDVPEKNPDQSPYEVVEQAQLRVVETFLIDEIFRAMGIQADSLLRKWFGPLFSPFVHRVGQYAVSFDNAIAQHGFQKAAQNW